MLKTYVYICPVQYLITMEKNKKALASARYERLISVVKLIGYKRIGDFCETVGVEYNNVRQMAVGRVVNFNRDILEFLKQHHPEVNVNYLVTGEGLPIEKNSAATAKDIEAKTSQEIKSSSVIDTIPFYDVSATAGHMTLTLEDAKTYASDHIHTNALKGAQVAISVHGDSMSDAFPGGSIIALRLVEDIEVIPYGEAYVIETADHRLLKYIRRGSTPTTVLLVSHNEAFEPFEIERKKIRKLWKVLGMIRRIQS